ERETDNQMTEKRRKKMAADYVKSGCAREDGGGREVLFAQCEHFSSDLTSQSSPADQRENNSDAKINLDGGPVIGQGGRQRHPKGNGGKGLDDLNQALNGEVGPAAKISGDRSRDQADQKAERNADEPDRQGNARPVEDSGKQVPSDRVCSEEKQRPFSFDAQQVAVCFKKTPEAVRLAAHEQFQRCGVVPVFKIIFSAGLRMTLALERVNERTEMKPLLRHKSN